MIILPAGQAYLSGLLMGKEDIRMDWGMVAVFFIICTGGGVIQAVCGFGFGVFVMMFLPYMMPSTLSAVVVSSLLGMSSSGILALRYRKFAVMKKIIVPLLAYFVVSTFLVRVSITMNEVLIRRLLGGLMLALSVYFIKFSNQVHIRPTRVNAAIAGGLGGTMSTLFGMGGPPISAYYLADSDSNEEYLANIQLYTLLSNIYVNLMRVANGLCGRLELGLWGIGILAVFLGGELGKRVFSRLNGDMLRRLVYAFMAVSGLIMIFKK